jgi:hypothetical protein
VHCIFRKVPANYVVDAHNKSDAACGKYANRRSRFMPGVLLVFCLDHGTFLGFHVMHNHESPRTLFELFFTRWRVAPRLICYDNACNLAKFCLAREYAFFKRTKFVIDKLHFYAHKLCSPVYNPYFHWELDDCNTQLCEQFNKDLSGMKTQLIYFSWTPWLFHLQAFIFMARANREH